MTNVLIVDDEPVILKILGMFLHRDDRRLLFAASGEEALRVAGESGPIDVALVDKNLGDRSGLDVARELKAGDPDLEVILVTGYASLQSAVEAVQLRAFDYVMKPIEDFDALALKVANAIDKAQLARAYRRTVAQLRESEDRWRHILDSTPDALLVFDQASGELVQVNPAACEAFGHSAEELAGTAVGRLFELGALPPAGGAEVVRCRRRDGATFPAEVRRGELVLHGRRCATCTVRDVTARERLAEERRVAEEQLRHAQKMEAITRLAGGIGHDLGNLLAVIMTHADVLREGAPPHEDLDAIVTAADRSAALVRQMMQLSRRGPAMPVVLSLNGAVSELARMLRRTLGETVQLVTELDPRAGSVRMDAGHLAQALLNLSVNARDAMPSGGRLVIRTARSAPGALLPGAPGGEHAVLIVADTGTGIAEEVRARIFEPFFTTKEPGRGTGLGLAVTHGIVAQAGGVIDVDSKVGHGTTFRIFLPVAAPESPEVPLVAPAGRSPGPGGTVLVAEDEVSLRNAMAGALSAAGLHVLGAGSAEEAFAVAKAHPTPIDVLVADVVLPQMSGADLSDLLRDRHPALKVLLVTGFPGDARVAGAASRGSEILQKPFRGAALVERVRAMLG